MAHIHVTRRPNVTWLGVVGVALAVAGAGGAALFWWPGAPQQAAVSAMEPTRGVAALADHATSAMTAGAVPDVAAVVAQQVAAAQEIERQPDTKPVKGSTKERPAFVSAMEWQMLQGAAQQHATPDKELTRLVNNLRFMKQLELWQSMSTSSDLAKRQLLATQLLDDLPQRLINGELELAEAQKLQQGFLEDAVRDPQERTRRAAQEALRLVLPAGAEGTTSAVR
ncbi:MAG: hypothetical protein KGL90_11285 [Burkholderiales bacterium]|nr:hypothetical protein [Burkholderiales bacterium]